MRDDRDQRMSFQPFGRHLKAPWGEGCNRNQLDGKSLRESCLTVQYDFSGESA
jgi:hypothetical protein